MVKQMKDFNPTLPKQRVNIYRDPCFCQSGRVIADCCFAKINTAPPLPKTGYSHPKCYAQSLEDCSTKISREHLISRSILDIFTTKTITVSGLKWLENDRSQQISMNGLVSNVLCDRHNASLSGLDQIAQKFFKAIFGKNEGQWVAVIRGSEVERWMLKTLLSMAYSGNLHFNGTPLEIQEPLPLLNTLFLGEPLPEGTGLAFVTEEVTSIQSNRIMWGPLFHEAVGLLGCELYFSFARMLLFIRGPVPNLPHVEGQQKGLIYHPSGILVKYKDEHREIHLGWPENNAFVVEVGEITASAATPSSS